MTTLDDAAEPLENLRWHWGSAYLIHWFEPEVWVAERRDDHATLKADTPHDLRDKISADYLKCPVSVRVERPEVHGGATVGRFTTGR
jgi:hypothetical protein